MLGLRYASSQPTVLLSVALARSRDQLVDWL